MILLTSDSSMCGSSFSLPPLPFTALYTYILTKHDLARLRAVFGRQQIPYSKEHQEQFHSTPDRIILITRADVSYKDGRAGESVELLGEEVEDRDQGLGEVVDESRGGR